MAIISVDREIDVALAPRSTATEPTRRCGWIEDWDPDDESFWANGRGRTAKKNLALWMLAEYIGFSIWVLWTVVRSRSRQQRHRHVESELSC